jgi:glycosyltransferase involved in cell wall biosynthesis
MKILHVINSVDPRSGGPGHAIRGMAAAQAARGNQVAVLATGIQVAEPWHPQADYLREMLANPVFAGVELVLGRAFGRRRPWDRYAFSPQSAAWLRRRMADSASRPDVVHIHGVFSHVTTVAAATARRHGIPYVLRPAGSLDGGCLDSGHRRLKDWFVRWFLRRDLDRAARIHATSELEANNLARLGLVERVCVIPHGVPVPNARGGCDARDAEQFLTEFPQLKGRRIVLCLGRIDPIKRFPLAVEALGRLRESHADLTLVIAGFDAGHLAEVQTTAARLGLADRVVYAGFLQGERKQAAFAAASAFVLPSSHENFGVAAVEAMAHGVPAVVTPEVASHEYVDRCRGGFTVAGTADAIADGLCRVLSGDGPHMGRRGRDFVLHHLSWDAVAGRLEEMYEGARKSFQRSAFSIGG